MGELLLVNLSMHMMHLTTHYAAITGNEQEFSTRTIHLKKIHIIIQKSSLNQLMQEVCTAQNV